ncbi:MAG: phosphoribosylformylglycinamidine synthase [Porticoccaceae bacterium]|nr:phosphoribosylformylglycinamidine synthase [Porticoccaceae bacterium]|tara:strand:+ start:7846 stop:11712 length:3867 start_codon:yes stop_codon:yes gene_type:complete
MIIFDGGPCFSDFRKHKLLLKLQAAQSSVLSLKANYKYFVDTDSLLSERQTTVLQSLLNCRYHSPATDFSTQLFLVVPRLGTISAWSSKATDIARNCGLDCVLRVERGIAFSIATSITLDRSEEVTLAELLYDRMIETIFFNISESSKIFMREDPVPVKAIDILDGGFEMFRQVNLNLGLALSDSEMDFLRHEFSKLRRNPTDVELMMFAQANSEHCRHKIFNSRWIIDGTMQEKTLFEMIRNTHHKNSMGILSAYSDNAAVVQGSFGGRFFPDPRTREYAYSPEDIHFLMKVETHNHPTAIFPYAGAGTGAGGEIRDEGAVGQGSKPKAGITGFSVSNLNIPSYIQPWELDYGRPGRIASALEIMLEGPIGAAAFNNEFGRPNINGYFRCFELEINGQCYGYHKPIMISGGYGNIRPQHVLKKPFQSGAKLVVLGGPAMLIGLGGGAASSVTTGESSAELDFGSVQRQNPEMERRCQEVIDHCWQLGDKNPIAFIHDVGAGGLSNAFPELIKDGGVGGHFKLRRIPNAEPQMSPLEIWCNEAQERYVLAIKSDYIDVFARSCIKERCPFAIVGEAIEEKKVVVEDEYFKNTPIDLPLALIFPLSDLAPRTAIGADISFFPLSTKNMNLNRIIDLVIRHPTVASKNFLITIGDRSVGGMVTRDQMVGPWQVPVADCAATTLSFDSYRGEAVAMGERSPLAVVNAPASGRMAIGEAITNIAASSIASLSDVRLSANWMCASGCSIEEEKLFRTVEAVGMELCPALGISVPVGKDSMSMQTNWDDDDERKSVVSPLSLIVSAFAPVVDVRKILTPQLRTDCGDTRLILLDLGTGLNRLGGSILAQVNGQIGDRVPDLDDPDVIINFFDILQMLNKEGELLAYHDRSDGGLIVTLLEMSFAGRVGIDINIETDCEKDSYISGLFSEELGAVIQVKACSAAGIIERCKALNICCHEIGGLNSRQIIRVSCSGVELFCKPRADLHRAWSELSYQMSMLRDNSDCAQSEFDRLTSEDAGLSVKLNFQVEIPVFIGSARPRIAVLREQGVNGQLEMAAAFDRAKFASVDVHMSELLSGEVQLSNFVGLVACGGFSYGDVLGAGQGWAKTILFNSNLRDEFSSFFHRSETFSLGVCNGCQMLSHLRELIPGSEPWPFFERNLSEQFEARFSLVRIEKSPSILLKNMTDSHIPIVVSHGEGRVKFDNDDMRIDLETSNMVSMRFLDNDLAKASSYPANPNGSLDGITGICSRDGRVTLMMPHPERVFRTVLNSWHPKDWGEDAPWMQLFYNARRFVE